MTPGEIEEVGTSGITLNPTVFDTPTDSHSAVANNLPILCERVTVLGRLSGRKVAGTDAITVLVAENGFAAKTLSHSPSGTIIEKGYCAGMWYRYLTYDISNLEDLSAVLDVIQTYPRCLVVRGAPARHLSPESPVRRLKENFPEPACGRHWLMIDFDKIPLPIGLSLRRSKRQVIEFLVSKLPDDFHNVSYYWQLSSKAGFTSDAQVSLHLWFWLRKPVAGNQLKVWGENWNLHSGGHKLIDTALFNDVQAHYTSKPILIGLEDPFPTRSGLVEKNESAVDLQIPKLRPSRSLIAERKVPAFDNASAASGFEAILRTIGDHKGGGGFHQPIIRAIASYVATHGPNESDRNALKERVRDAIRVADHSLHSAEYLDQMASDAHLDSAIDSARRKFAPECAPFRRPRLTDGVKPHYVRSELKREQAMAALISGINSFFSG
jgi:hypothetical protein